MKKRIVFGAGCFWHIQKVFLQTNGVLKATSGYMGGDEKKFPSPTYEQVCSGKSGYVEVVEIEYDEKKIDFKKLLEIFWSIHDPTSIDKQGNDVGTQYRSVIFYCDDEQGKEAKKSKDELQRKLSKRVVTKILPAKTFFRAEEYHQLR